MRGVENVEEAFDAEVRVALRHKAGLERSMAKLYEMLPDMRRAKVGPKAIETRSQGLIPRDTASRKTAPVIGTSRKPRAS